MQIQTTAPAEQTITIGDFEFRFSGRARDARITSELLAKKLGYQVRRDLESLADRHVDVLQGLGVMCTVPITVKRGISYVQVEMPLYNERQVLYLIAKSETEVANQLTAEFIQAFEHLLERVEQMEADRRRGMTQIQLLSQMAQAMEGLEQEQSAQARLLHNHDWSLNVARGAITAVQTAGIETQKRVRDLESRIKELEADKAVAAEEQAILEDSRETMSIQEFSRLHQKDFPRAMASQLGKMAKRISLERGVPVGRARSGDRGKYTYRRDIIKEAGRAILAKKRSKKA